MVKKYTILLFCFISYNISFSQTEKAYYNKDWKICDESKADYYRLITNDKKSNPKGKIKSFYITGELRSEGNFSYIDFKNSGNDLKDGIHIFYFKSGNKEANVPFINGKRNGLQTTWYEGGELETESFFKNGLAEGNHTYYHKNGNIKVISSYKDDKRDSKYYIYCNELNNCEKVFNNYVYTDKYNNAEEWNLIDNEFAISKLKAGEGLHINSFEFGSGTLHQTLNLPFDLESNFSIDVRIECQYINNDNYHGIVWGYEDYENYNYFYINFSGFFKVGKVVKGIDLIDEKSYSSNINQDCYQNSLKIIRQQNNLFYSINNEIVHKDNFSFFKGYNVGFAQGSHQKLLYNSFELRYDIDSSLITNKDSSTTEDGWTGNGTGFFIDKNGFIATNYHVIKDSKKIEIEFVRNGLKVSYPAEIVKSDKQNDISVLKIISLDFEPFSSIPYNFKTKISDVGSEIFALGYPLALSVMGTEIKFTDGKISSKTGMNGDITTYQISVPIQPGNSGGPLFDFNGNLIGITSSTINRKLNITENVNYAIKSSYLKNLIDVLDYKINPPNDNSISNLSLTEKIKELSSYVVLIRIK
jgi:S1-C subfamily serine protease/antitoxin component YwqK of YwqJK toxin-antitoxin module